MRSSGFFTILCLSAIVSLAGCSDKRREADKQQGVAAVAIKGIALEAVTSAARAETVEVVGTVRARTSAVVSTRIPGSVTLLRVREGDRVTRGQLLLQLDAQENQATAAMAVAGIDEAGRGLDEALSRKRLADTTFERYQKLFSEQAVTRQEFDTRQTEKELAAQGVARSEARLKQAREGSRAAATMAGYTRIVSPISGVITGKSVDLGATVFPGQPLLTIEEGGNYQLELAVPESQGIRIKSGTAVQVALDALGSSFSAVIAEVVPAADPASRTITVKIPVNRNGVKSGMFGRGSISLGTTVNGITVPKQSIREQGAMTSVWVLDTGNIARLRIVKSGEVRGGRTEILSGLTDGERVVVGGMEKLIEGAKVE